MGRVEGSGEYGVGGRGACEGGRVRKHEVVDARCQLVLMMNPDGPIFYP